MDRKKALFLYLSGTIGQISIICMIVFLLRSLGRKIDGTTISGMLAIGAGGISSALWGAVVAVKYKKITIKQIGIDFINVKQAASSYLTAAVFLLLDFCFVFVGGKLLCGDAFYIPLFLFCKAIVFGGIEEIGWRYTFQPILEEKLNYIFATMITFVSWGIWHLLYFYIEGTLHQVCAVDFLKGLFTNCFILSALYNKTKSLWICVMTHALINTFSQMSSGGNVNVLFLCRIIIIIIAVGISRKAKREL